jgi:hypothetical protein
VVPSEEISINELRSIYAPKMIKMGKEISCIFRGNVAIDSDPKWPPIPKQDGHLFRSIVAGHSDPIWSALMG